MHYVIIGNSAAAVGAVEGIRSRDKENPVTIISAEPYHTYSRPLISYFLGKKVKKENMFYRSKDFYTKNNATALLGSKVTKLRLSEQSLVLGGADTLSYDRLLLATGGTPFIPPIKGLNNEKPVDPRRSEVDEKGVYPNAASLPRGSGQDQKPFSAGNIFTFTNWDDAKVIARVAKKGAKALIIGGGLIGLKACEGLLALGVKVTIVELAERVLITALDARGSHLMLKHLRSLGVRVLTGTTVEEIAVADAKEGEKATHRATLKDGREIECDFIIVAIGVRPNLELIQGTPIMTNRGILVDNYMETSTPGVFAAGDVAETQDVIYGTRRVIPIWPNAYQQGKIAGMNMVSRDREYTGSFGMNSIEICGLPTISAGMVDAPANGYKEYRNLAQINPKKGSYRRFVIRDNKLIAAIMVGDIRKAGMFTSLIGNQVEIKSFINELTKDDFGYISLPDDMRREKLLAK